MTNQAIENHLPAAGEALDGFLGMLLSGATPLEFEEPTATDSAAVAAQAVDHVALVGGSEAERFAVLLEKGWVPALAQATLGEPLQAGEAGADDLISEMAAQGYGAVQSSLADAGVTLGVVSFDVHASADELPAFAADLIRVAFSMEHEGKELRGFAVLPAVQAAQPEAQPATPPAPSPSSPSTTVPPAGGSSPPVDNLSSGGPRPVSAPASVASVAFPDLGAESIGGDGADANFALLAEVELEVTVELGRRRLPLSDLLQLTTGSVVELEKLVGEPLEVYANGRLIAEGEAVVIDEQFGVRITGLAARQRGRALL